MLHNQMDSQTPRQAGEARSLPRRRGPAATAAATVFAFLWVALAGGGAAVRAQHAPATGPFVPRGAANPTDRTTSATAAQPAATTPPRALPADAPLPSRWLAGRTICVDPGHGGPDDSGTSGPGGLLEKNINLRVSLRLRDLLEGAGAKVIMTRTADTGVPVGKRAEINKASGSELFISVHHNANAQNDTTMNRTEVFYPWYDNGGPSEDMARLLQRELYRAYGLPGKTYVAWSYGMLRNNAGPAVLGEASYLTNPAEAARFKDPAHFEAQAQAYFRAAVAFFAHGRPQVSLMPPPVPGAPQVVQAAISARPGDALVDPQTLQLDIDGNPLRTGFYSKGRVGLLLAQLPDQDFEGTRTLTVSARNLAGHISDVVRARIVLGDGKAQTDPAAAGSKPARRRTLQILGADPAAPGQARPLPGATVIGQQLRALFAVAGAKGLVTLDAAERDLPEPHLVAANGYWTQALRLRELSSVTLRPMFGGVLHGKRIVIDPANGGDDPGPVSADGVRAADANLRTALYLAAYLERAGAQPILTRTTDKSLDNVERVRIGLSHVPAVFLTIGYRTSEPGMGEKPGQNISRIGHRWGDARIVAQSLIFHVRQALGTGAAFGDVNLRRGFKEEVHNWSSWEAMHGAQNFRSVHVSPLMFDGEGAAARLAGTAAPRKAALGILWGLAQLEGWEEVPGNTIEGKVVGPDGAAIGDALVWLNDTLVAQTESDGRFRFKGVETGTARLWVEAAGYAGLAQEVLVSGNGSPLALEAKLAAEQARR